MLPSPNAQLIQPSLFGETMRIRIREGTGRALAAAYFKSRTRPNQIALIQHVNLAEAEPLLARLKSCKGKRCCRAYTCAYCGEKLKAQVRDQALKRLVECLGRFPEPEEVSWITINGPRTCLQIESARDGIRKLQSQLDNFIRRKLRGTGWFGVMDISTTGLVHIHALVLHPGVARKALEASLEESFPDPKQFKLSRWNRSQSLAEALQSVANYSIAASRHVRVIKFVDGPDRQDIPTSVEDTVRRIIVVQALAGKGVQGLRFIRGLKALHKGIRVSQLENLLRRTKRIRRSSNHSPKKPWAPRGPIGFHLNSNPDLIPSDDLDLNVNALTRNRIQSETQQVSIPSASEGVLEGMTNTVTGTGHGIVPAPSNREDYKP